MSPLVPVVMFGWIPVVLALFAKLPARTAVIAGFMVAWLFLPMASYPLPGIPDYTKMSATCAGVFLAAAIYDSERLKRFRPEWVDLFMAIWFLSALPSSLVNGLGAYDGTAVAFEQFVKWGMPYLVGRLYLGDLDGLRQLATAMVISGLAYVPFCVFELIMSPQLHNMFYGFHQHHFAQTMRDGGFRPMVFMQHGLMAATWMTSASLLGIWLWFCGSLRSFLGIRMEFWLLILVPVTFALKSMGAVSLLIMGLGVLIVTSITRKGILIGLMLIIPIVYMVLRGGGWWTGDNLVSQIEKIHEERAASLQFRLDNEAILAEKAMIQPVFGWGGWGRALIYDEDGKKISVTDGLWVIVLGERGIFGLTFLTLVILGPVCMLAYRYPVKNWGQSDIAPASGLAMLLILYMIDSLLNAMVNPIFMLAAGGLMGLKTTLVESDTALSAGETLPVYMPHGTRFL
ncbi:MAG: hypothetical protein AB7S77_08915 [Desulfatirhabdiaceae bacterium]